MPNYNYAYAAKLVRVVDGDTVHLDVDLGFRTHSVVEFRLLGINTPEVIGASKEAGLAAKAELQRLLGLGSLRVVSVKTEKYGRWLVSITVSLPSGSTLNVNEELVRGGFAKPYDGQGAKV